MVVRGTSGVVVPNQNPVDQPTEGTPKQRASAGKADKTGGGIVGFIKKHVFRLSSVPPKGKQALVDAPKPEVSGLSPKIATTTARSRAPSASTTSSQVLGLGTQRQASIGPGDVRQITVRLPTITAETTAEEFKQKFDAARKKAANPSLSPEQRSIVESTLLMECSRVGQQVLTAFKDHPEKINGKVEIFASILQSLPKQEREILKRDLDQLTDSDVKKNLLQTFADDNLRRAILTSGDPKICDKEMEKELDPTAKEEIKTGANISYLPDGPKSSRTEKLTTLLRLAEGMSKEEIPAMVEFMKKWISANARITPPFTTTVEQLTQQITQRQAALKDLETKLASLAPEDTKRKMLQNGIKEETTELKNAQSRKKILEQLNSDNDLVDDGIAKMESIIAEKSPEMKEILTKAHRLALNPVTVNQGTETITSLRKDKKGAVNKTADALFTLSSIAFLKDNPACLITSLENSTPNYIKYSDSLTEFVRKDITSNKNVSFWIDVAKASIKKGDSGTANAICTILFGYQKSISKKDAEIFAPFMKLEDNFKTYRKYREEYQSGGKPFIPMPGIDQKDITFILENVKGLEEKSKPEDAKKLYDKVRTSAAGLVGLQDSIRRNLFGDGPETPITTLVLA
jgi:hypothetical protein